MNPKYSKMGSKSDEMSEMSTNVPKHSGRFWSRLPHKCRWAKWWAALPKATVAHDLRCRRANPKPLCIDPFAREESAEWRSASSPKHISSKRPTKAYKGQLLKNWMESTWYHLESRINSLTNLWLLSFRLRSKLADIAADHQSWCWNDMFKCI